MTEGEEEDTETKLAILSSIFTCAPQETLLEILIRAEGNIPRAIDLHLDTAPTTTSDQDLPRAKRRKPSGPSSPSRNSGDGGQWLKWTDSAEPPRKVLPKTPKNEVIVMSDSPQL